MTKRAMAIWGMLATIYGLGITAGVAAGSRGPDLVTGAALVASGSLLAARPSRVAAATLAGVALAATVGPAPSTMTAMVWWVSAALALFEGRDLLAVVRVQVVVIYGFAGLNKLLSQQFRSGDVLAGVSQLVPAPRFVAVGVVVSELALAVAVARRWPYVPLAVVAFHTPIVLLAATSPAHGAILATYAAMMLWATWHVRRGNDGQRDQPPTVRGSGPRPWLLLR